MFRKVFKKIFKKGEKKVEKLQNLQKSRLSK